VARPNDPSSSTATRYSSCRSVIASAYGRQ
jgi:hypothetical protein